MGRVVLLFVLLLASLSFLFLQLLSLKGIDNQKWASKIGEAVGLGRRKDNTAWKNLNTISQFAENIGFQLFLVDPDILQDIIIEQIGNSMGNHSKYAWNFAPRLFSDCHHVCGRQRIILGVFAKLWESAKTEFLRMILQQGFQQNCCQNQDPRTIAIDSVVYSSIDFHCAFASKDSVVDIVVFYEWESFLWHGTVAERGNEKSKTGLDFGKTAGVFNRFRLTKVAVDGISLWMPKNPSHFLAEMKLSQFLQCDVQQARTFYSLYGEVLSPEEEEFKNQAREALSAATTALDGIGVRFWLSSGTCLGWFRQCDVIPHSKDVDIGIWIKDYDTRLIDRMNKYGLILSHKFGQEEDSFELSFRMSGNDAVKLDVFFFYEENDHMWNGGTQAKTGMKFKYIFPKFTLCWTVFLSLRVRVPCGTQSYIEANYGKTWDVPVKIWNWKESPPNVRPNGQWDEKDWPEVIQLM